MAIYTKMLLALLCIVLLDTASVGQPWPSKVLDIRTIDSNRVEPGSTKNSLMPAAYTPAAGRRFLPAGSWGGRHISMEVGAGQTRIGFDCAQATIASRILLDSRGRFTIKGVYVEERGGPTRQGLEKPGYPVRFTGSVMGKRMKLSITRTDKKELIGTFTLTHGQEPELVKCR